MLESKAGAERIGMQLVRRGAVPGTPTTTEVDDWGSNSSLLERLWKAEEAADEEWYASRMDGVSTSLSSSPSPSDYKDCLDPEWFTTAELAEYYLLDRVYHGLRQRAGRAVYDFRDVKDRENCQCVAVVGDITVAVYMLFHSKKARDMCLQAVRHGLKGPATVWLSRSLDRRGSEGTSESCIVLHVASSYWKVIETVRVSDVVGHLEDFLGCPSGRDGQLNGVLRQADAVCFETIPLNQSENWRRSRKDLLGDCKEMEVLPKRWQVKCKVDCI